MGTTAQRQVKKALRDHGVTYGDVANLAGVSWHFVWCVVNGRKRSARVMGAIERLTGGAVVGAAVTHRRRLRPGHPEAAQVGAR